ncbi:MAG: hypothetical protein EAX90_02905 [Candidatus Heimdallarchaeota archaeon]|nr:hypothetical protein [Candidatus Heimdallarchaeota archaeon]
MATNTSVQLIDITDVDETNDYFFYLHRCFVGPFRKYRRRESYLKEAIPAGFKKKLLIFNNDRIGQIEYSPPGFSYYPIQGENIIVLNCIWVLSRAKGYNFGRLMFEDMLSNSPDISGVATIALEGHWGPWFNKKQIEIFGFKSIDSFKVSHKRKLKEKVFTIHLMWLPLKENAKHPTWVKEKLLEGIPQCMFHPLYNPQSYKEKNILVRS